MCAGSKTSKTSLFVQQCKLEGSFIRTRGLLMGVRRKYGLAECYVRPLFAAESCCCSSRRHFSGGRNSVW